MKFFIPFADSPEQENQVYNSIQKHLGKELGADFSERQIQYIKWRHNGKTYTAKVGESTSFNGEPVIAILFEPMRNLYHICTPNRGVAGGGSILAGASSVLESADFD